MTFDEMLDAAWEVCETYGHPSTWTESPKQANEVRAWIEDLLRKHREACAQTCLTWQPVKGIYLSGEGARDQYGADVRKTPLVEF